MIFEKSQNKYYKNPALLKSLSRVNDIVQIVRRDCSEYNLSDLCKLILQHEQNLRNILPAHNNNTYNNQTLKLEELLFIAKQNKKP